MRIGTLARRAGVTTKAVRYYESLGLVDAPRAANGYRDFDERHVRLVLEIRQLAEQGIPPSSASPFLRCLAAGHQHGDDCVESLAAYRDGIRALDEQIAHLVARRDQLRARLHDSAERAFTKEMSMTDYTILPEGLPVPTDDGGADHLPGLALPSLTLPTSDGSSVRLDDLGEGRSVIYLYPLTGRPGVDLPAGWDEIPGARGCSTEACDFRDHFKELSDAGAGAVFGLSSQDPTYQAEVVERLHLPFSMISDEALELADSLDLPTFTAPGHDRLYSRLTLIVSTGRIEHAFYPIFPPNEHAQQVIQWLLDNPTESAR